MKVKDQTYRNRLKSFIITFLATFLGVLLYQYVISDYNHRLISIGLTDFLTPIVLGLASAIYTNKMKVVISNIDNINEFKEWLNNYFKSYEAKLIYSSNHYLVYEKTTKAKGVFRRAEKSYFEVIVYDREAEIEGPKYEMPENLNFEL